MPYIDFNEIKQRYTIERVAQLLDLTLKRAGDALRGPCPACQSGGERALVVTPAKGVFYCWTAHEGGDLIQLAAHMRKTDVKAAAARLSGSNDGGSREKSPKGAAPRPDAEQGLKPLDLEYDHPAVAALGFGAEEAETLGVGYCARGIMRGLVVAPIRLEDGTLAGYLGLTEIAKLPPRWHGISTNVVPSPKRA